MAHFVKRVWEKHRWVRLAVIAVLITLAIVLVGGGSIAVWLQWEWLRSSEGTNASNGDTLRNVGFIIAGMAALGFAIWRGVVAQSQAKAAHGQTETAQQSLLNERYQRGAEMLGSSVLSVRLGGIYALQRLAEEHTEHYHVQVMRLFCAFVRNPPRMRRTRAARKELRPDVQVVISAIGERSDSAQLLEAEAGFKPDLRSSNLENAEMREMIFTGADLQDARIGGADLVRTELSGAHLPKANLSRAVLVRANLSDARLTEADLSHARLTRANFSHCKLTDANLAGALLARANFSGADLTDANLAGNRSAYADFSHATMIRTNLSQSDLSGGDFSDAFLMNVNLSGANLKETNFSGAELSGANLSGADLENATVSGARLGIEPIHDAVGKLIPLGGHTYVSQRQLDQTVADLNNPPIIPAGAADPETGDPLVWHGRPLNPQS